jgi:gp16 family phage-associated protein
MRKTSTRVKQKVRAALLIQGKTLSDWANENGFKPKTVYQSLWRCETGETQKPRSALLKALEKDTGVKLC